LRTWLLETGEPSFVLLAAPEAPSPEEPFDPDEPKNWQSLDYIEEIVQKQIEQQNDIWDVVDGRLRLILGVIGIVFAAVLGFQRGPAQLEFPVALLVVVAVILFLQAGIIAAVVYWPMDFNWPPQPAALRDEYLTTDPRQTKHDVVERIIYRYETNGLAIERKMVGFRAAFSLTALAVVALAIALVFHIVGQSKALHCSGNPSLLWDTCRWFQSSLGPTFGGSP
jgi:hypothetical protein